MIFLTLPDGYLRVGYGIGLAIQLIMIVLLALFRPARKYFLFGQILFLSAFALLLIVYSLIGGNESIFLATFIGLPFLLLGIVALIDRRRRAPVVGPGFVTPEIGLDRHGGIITVLRASPQFVSAARELARPQIQPVPDASPGTVQATSPPNGFGGATPAAHAPPSQEAPAGTGTAPGTPSWPLPAAERATDAPPPWWSS